MKRSLVFALFVLTGCGSSTDLIETESILCAEMGNEISVGLYAAESDRVPAGARQQQGVTLKVEVSNNSHQDVVVKSIVLSPTDPRARIKLNTAHANFNQEIAEGKEHVFTLRTTGTWQTDQWVNVSDRPSGSVEVESRVELTSGQIYRCRFEVPLY